MVLTYLQTIARQVYTRGEIGYPRNYRVYVSIENFKTDFDQVLYEGCPSNKCKKKVQPRDTVNGLFWYCPKCNFNYTSFQYRYKLKVRVTDGSRTFWVTMFDNIANPFLGISAPDIAELHNYDREEYYSYFQNLIHQMVYFTLRVKLVIFQDGPYLNCIVLDFGLDGYYY